MKSGELPLLLVIDDDPDQLALVRIAAMHAGGLRVIAAESGPEALVLLDAREQMRLAPPDLVLADLKMPDMSGLELMQQLRRKETLRDIPVVLLTSSSYNRDRIVAHTAGATAFFQKPIRFADLVRLLEILPSYLGPTEPPGSMQHATEPVVASGEDKTMLPVCAGTAGVGRPTGDDPVPSASTLHG